MSIDRRTIDSYNFGYRLFACFEQRERSGKLHTKQIIIQKSLILFSQNGYSGTSIRDIAKVVGIRESSIYKHFDSKQSILDQIIKEMQNRIRETFYLERDTPESDGYMNRYRNLTYEQTCSIAWRMFELFTKDYYISAYRRLLMREQFNNEVLAEQYDRYFLTGVIENQTKIFKKLIDEKVFRDEDPKLIAIQFYGVIFSLFQVYDSHSQKDEEIKGLLFHHIKTLRDYYIVHD